MLMLNKKFQFLKPYESGDLIRLGRKEDGGYVVSKKTIDKCNLLISFGMANDWSFENDFIKQKSENLVHIYDHTVSLSFFIKRIYKSFKRIFYLKSSIKNIYRKIIELINFLKIDNTSLIHFKKKVDLISSKHQISIDDIFSKSNSNKIVLKIDIESDEYKILDQILKYEKLVEMMLIEFHNLDIKKDEFVAIISKIQNYFNIIHIHANNMTGYCQDGLPITLEISFLKKKQKLIQKNRKIFPIPGLDFPNHPNIKDLEINFGD